MTWVVAILLALVSFAVAAVVFRLPRATWGSFAAALVFGLAGYTLQASPDVPAAPKALTQEDFNDDWQVVDSRKVLVGSDLQSSSDAMLTADAFARRGQFEVAAGFLGGVVKDRPQDFEAWVALGNALTEQADGMLTQASLYAFRQASVIAPENPAPAYFLGLSLVRQGRMMEARQAWRSALALTGEEDSVARAFLADRVERLEALLSQSGAIPQEGME